MNKNISGTDTDPNDKKWYIITSNETDMVALEDKKNPKKIHPSFGGASSLTNYSNTRPVTEEEAKTHLEKELEVMKIIQDSEHSILGDKVIAIIIYKEMQRFYNLHFGSGIYMTPEELALAEEECPGYTQSKSKK